MKKELVEHIKEKLKEVINQKRYIHTLGVVDAAVYLAEKYGADLHEAEIAALLHDYAKDFTEEQLKGYIKKHGLEVDEVLMEAYQLLHGKVAAHIARVEFNIHNENILKAVENHTTGAANMGKLERIIYLADFIEVGRNYQGVDELRLLAEENLDRAVLQAFNNTIHYVLSIGKLLHPNTIHGRNELLQQVKDLRGDLWQK
ncbi:bis(5'-nucleosyl)-tetraphosphatase (symmetrical) YqeK [Alkaliphilus hydrothermalis]|uniref:bis(5'-nucleosyl)-tetraphosphatase (symmetrical) n=1 Tax=Alkaliphilus hydrothermalis TaxID=1482730 RepID=A0ABS2NS72_9FIRM|nr:bis(5'-nucleosyl)-tetraphosphatase (symmetrical) YqeK [Alkaliphilus hydrothermalis]MBM7615815.1 putative HD superfamily hydrolase involved in NAD metabolism [Alkaliphilus hydrothermalis]